MENKDFDKWNYKKKIIDLKDDIPYFKEGDIWWIHLGLNIGYEINGKGNDFVRPIIVIKKYNQYSFLGLPVGTSGKVNKYRVSVGILSGKEAFANMSQLRNIDSKRLINKIGHLNYNEFKQLKEKTSQLNFG